MTVPQECVESESLTHSIVPTWYVSCGSRWLGCITSSHEASTWLKCTDRTSDPFVDSGDSAELIREGLDALIEADAWQRIETALARGIKALEAGDPGAKIPDLKVLLVLGDPGNEHFMNEVQGLSGFGGISGYIVLTLWPTPRVLQRLEAIAVHELHHNVRYSPGRVVWDSATVTVGEHVVSDWVLGDATARHFGSEPVGLPTGAGYAAGVRLVGACLDAGGGTAAENVRRPAVDIIETALPCLGLKPLNP